MDISVICTSVFHGVSSHFGRIGVWLVVGWHIEYVFQSEGMTWWGDTSPEYILDRNVYLPKMRQELLQVRGQ